MATAITCSRRLLLDAARTAHKLTRRLKHLPISGRVLLRLRSGLFRVEVVGTDLDTEAGTYVGTTSHGLYPPGSVVVDGESLVGALRSHPGSDAVELAPVDGGLRIGGAGWNGFVQIPTYDPEEWPAPALVPESAREHLVDADLLRGALARTAFAAFRGASRPQLCGATLRDGYVFASDGKRLACEAVAGTELLSVGIPTPAVEALRHVAAEDAGQLSVYHSSERDRVWFLGEDGFVSTRPTGAAPDYLSMIPSKFPHVVDVDAAELRAAVEFAAAAQVGKKKDERIVAVTIDDLGFRVAAPDAPPGTDRRIGTVWEFPTGKSYDDHYSAEFLADAAKAVRRGTLRLSFSGEGKPAVASRGAWRYAFMPVTRQK